MNTLLLQVVEQNQMEDPLAMSLATFAMSRPGSVMDSRPGSAMSIMSNVSPTKGRLHFILILMDSSDPRTR